jgi:hypothetical protein
MTTKTKIQMIADALALIEALDDEYYAKPATNIRNHMRMLTETESYVSKDGAKKDTVTLKDAMQRLDTVVKERETIFAALNALKAALDTANDQH